MNDKQSSPAPPAHPEVALGTPTRRQDSEPFVLIEPDFVCDSKKGAGVVEVTTTWLAANMYKGCPLGCVYCFRHRWHPGTDPTELATVDDAIAAILRHERFRPHVTPLTANISSTDAMHPRVRASTLLLMRKLDALGLRNPFGVTTKLPICDANLREWSSFTHLRAIVLVSYSAMPADVEPVPSEPRVRTLMRSRSHGLPTILLLKPIVEGWNSSRHQMAEVLAVGAKADAIVYGGLRVDSSIAAAIERSGRPAPVTSLLPWGSRLLEPSTEETLLTLHRSMIPVVPLYRHTSCAVSLVMATPNYNELFRRPTENCVVSCPQHQASRCSHES